MHKETGELQQNGHQEIAGLLLNINYDSAVSVKDINKKEVFTEYLHNIKQVSTQYNGFIEKIYGDTVFLVFGIPESQKDSAIRAVFTAIACQKTIRLLKQKYGIKVNSRAFIDTGFWLSTETEVLLDSLLKLEQLQIPEDIIITENAHSNTGKHFSVKEIKTETTVHKLYSVINVLKPPAFQKQLVSRFVGRNEEFGLLKKYVIQLINGESQVVSIVGEAGIGKSRLIRELTETYLLQQDIHLIKARASAYTIPDSYSMFRNMLNTAFNILPDDTEDNINKKITQKCVLWQMNPGEVCSVFGFIFSANEPENVSLSYEERKRCIFRTVRDILFNLAKEKPAVIIFEDMHWADPTSLELLTAIINSASHIPLLFLCIYRTGFMHSWAVSPHYTQIYVRELSKEETNEMISSLLEEEFIPGDISSAIIYKSEGHPLYVEEIVKTLITQSAIIRKPFGIEIVKKINEIKLPEKIENIILNRVELLPHFAQEILKVASVIGRQFQFQILKEISGKNIEEELSHLVSAEMVFLTATFPERIYLFKHIIIQQVIYNIITPDEKKNLHNLVAKAIEKLYHTKIENFYWILAHHYSFTDEYVSASKFLYLSGNKAKAIYANESAIECFTKAIEFAEKTDDFKTISTAHFNLGVLNFTIGKLDNALNNYEKCLKLAKIHNINDVIHECLFEMGRIFRRWGNFDKALNYYQAVMKQASEIGNKKLQAKCLHRIATIFYETGDKQKAEELLKNGLTLALEIDNKYLQASIYRFFGYINLNTGDYTSSENNLNKAITICSDSKNREGEIITNRYMGLLYFKQGKTENAIDLLEKTLTAIKATGDSGNECWCSNNLAEVYLHTGKFGKSQFHYTNSINIAKEMGYRIAEVDALNGLAIISRRLNDLSGSLENQKKAVEIAETTGNKSYISKYYHRLGVAYKDNGHLQKAVEFYNKAIENADNVRNIDVKAGAMLSMGAILEQWADYQKALDFYNKALELKTKTNERLGMVYCYTALSKFWSNIGDNKKAEDYADRAKQIVEAAGYQPQMCWVYSCYARVYSRRKNWSECEEMCQKSLNMANQLRYLSFKAIAYTDLAFVSTQLKKFNKAIEYQKNALEIYKKTRASIEFVKTIRGLCILYYLVGRKYEAEEMLTGNIELAESLHMIQDLVRMYHYLGLIADEFENNVKTEYFLNKAWKLQLDIIGKMPPELQTIYIKNPIRKQVFQDTIAFYTKQKEPIPEELKTLTYW